MDSVYSDTLMTILTQYPDGLVESVGWYYQHLSHNPHLPDQYIMNNLDKPWDYNQLLSNRSLTIETRLAIINYMRQHNIRVDVYHQGFIADLPVIQLLINTINVPHDLYLIIESETTEDEVIKWLYNSEYRDRIDWNIIHTICSSSMIEWFFANHPESIDIEDVANNSRISGNIVDNIIKNHHQYCTELIKCDDLTEQNILDIINHPQFNVRRINLINLVWKSPSLSLIELALNKMGKSGQYEVILNHLDHDAIRQLVTDQSILDELINYYITNADPINSHNSCRILSILLTCPVITSDYLIEILRDRYSIHWDADINKHNYYKMVYMIEYYRDNKIPVDMEVVRELINLGCDLDSLDPIFKSMADNPIAGVELYVDICYSIKQEYPPLRPISVHIDYLYINLEVNSLTTLINLVNSPIRWDTGRWSKIKAKFSTDYKVLGWIQDNKNIINYTDWKYLSEVVDYDLIVMFPELPWLPIILATRNYLPSSRLMKIKSAKY